MFDKIKTYCVPKIITITKTIRYKQFNDDKQMLIVNASVTLGVRLRTIKDEWVLNKMNYKKN
jgi:uncharacterized membrane protein YeiH